MSWRSAIISISTMNRHDSYQQPEAAADNANAGQWQIDLPEVNASQVGNDNASETNGGKSTNDTNHTSDQGETVEVRVIKGDRGESNDRPGQVEQGSQDNQTDTELPHSTNVDPEERNGRAVWTGAEVQPKKKGIIELLGSSPLGIMAQTALDSVRRFQTERQVDKQRRLIYNTSRTVLGTIKYRSKEEILKQQQEHARLNQLVEDGEPHYLIIKGYRSGLRLTS